MKLIERKIFSSLLYEFALQSIEAGKVTYKQLELVVVLYVVD